MYKCKTIKHPSPEIFEEMVNEWFEKMQDYENSAKKITLGEVLSVDCYMKGNSNIMVIVYDERKPFKDDELLGLPF